MFVNVNVFQTNNDTKLVKKQKMSQEKTLKKLRLCFKNLMVYR